MGVRSLIWFLHLKLCLQCGAGAISGGIAKGPSSSVDSYLVPITVDNGIYLKAVITVGDSADNGYKLVGVPDGLGAYDNGDGSFTLLMNHEIQSGNGAVRAHGGSGAFVSKWTIRKKDFRVTHGEDLIRKVSTWNRDTKAYNNPETSPAVNMSRFCSANLADPSAFYNKKTGKGTKDRIFMNGEETDVDGRAFAHIATGDYAGHTFELPYLGQGSFENQVAHPSSGNSLASCACVIGNVAGPAKLAAMKPRGLIIRSNCSTI